MWRALFILLAGPAAAQDPVKILETRCAGCHNAKTKQGGLDLTSRPAALRGGPRGPALVPGDAEASPLYQFAAHRKEPGMPLGGAKLTETELAALAAWIRAGAPFTGSLEAKTHWAFEAVRRPAVPAGAAHPIDAFLGPSAEPANRYTLLRRISLDLTGLPPTPAEINAFLADQSPGAWDAVVDRLLASPRYGERWGRHWMDIWRYSDWYGSGKEIRNSQPHIWRWRDWIIESLNANKSYGQMVREMLAADEIAPGDPNALRATGFLVRNWFLFNRNAWLQETIEGTTAGFLGLTLKCARCHDHKYDPLSQEDYYRFRAFFEPHDVRLDRVPGQADLAKDGLARVFDAAPRPDLANAAGTFLQPAIYADTFLFHKGDEKNPDKSRPLSPATPPALGPGIAAVRPVALPVNSYYPDLRPEVRDALLAAAQARVEEIARDLAGTRARRDAARTAPPWVRPAGPAVDFDRQVKPLLEARCGGCHLARNLKSGFNVATAKSVMAGGKRFGAAVAVARSAESPLLRMVRGELLPRMPLNGPPLTSAEIALLADWIDGMEPPPPATVVREAEERLAVGEKELAAARAHVEALAARAAAEAAKYAAEPGDPTAQTLALAARTAERRAAALAAEAELLRAQQRLADALSAPKLDDAKVAAAKRALEQAIEALNKPAEGYTPLGPLYPKTSTGRRTALAEWITRRDNPLTARVAVNHIWLRHFGTPLVASVADFGRNGKTPTHPALLDWLAAEFMDSNWDMKRLHRLIVTSQAYRARTATARRLEAEVIRDSVLAAAENLDLTMGGPELHEESQADTPRRSLYFRVTPDAQLTFLKVFDGVDPTACFVRPESIVPQQALALANSRLSLENARRLAERLAAAPDFTGEAFLRVLSRPPTEAERTLARDYLGNNPDRRALLIHALFNRNEFVTIR
ncbi:MAG: PSD1 domain-containing protein [Acidobacteriaceae bacterium]|nr:PSD1 domain-containing protein [Acidobacteriaceae bacterium]